MGLFLFFRTFAIKFVIVMKNLALFFLALLAFVACSQEQKSPFSYRGLAFTLSTSQFVDSMQARGFAVDSAASDSGRTVVLASPKEKYRVLVAFHDQQLQAIQGHRRHHLRHPGEHLPSHTLRPLHPQEAREVSLL